MEMVFKSQLISLQTKSKLMVAKKQKKQEKKGIEKYLAGDSDSDASGDSSDGVGEDESDDLTSGHYVGGKSIMKPEENHPAKLIDVELLNVLKFCGDLYNACKLNNEDYSEEIMLKSIELGKKTKQKVLVLDMDETMVSARFKSKLPEDFQTSFVIDFQGQPIHVRVRPYLQDCLERLS